MTGRWPSCMLGVILVRLLAPAKPAHAACARVLGSVDL